MPIITKRQQEWLYYYISEKRKLPEVERNIISWWVNLSGRPTNSKCACTKKPRALINIKQKLLELKGKIGKSYTVISTIDWTTRQKVRTWEHNQTTGSNIHIWNNLSKIRYHLPFKCPKNIYWDRLYLWYKTNFSTFTRIEIIQSMFSVHKRITLETNIRKIMVKFPSIWRVNNTLLNSP